MGRKHRADGRPSDEKTEKERDRIMMGLTHTFGGGFRTMKNASCHSGLSDSSDTRKFLTLGVNRKLNLPLLY